MAFSVFTIQLSQDLYGRWFGLVADHLLKVVGRFCDGIALAMQCLCRPKDETGR
jgi:hypothetical protein